MDEHDAWFEDLENRLRTTTSEKAWRFAIACCRRSWNLMTDVRQQRAIEAAEGFAEGRVPQWQFEIALKPIREVWPANLPSRDEWKTWHFLNSAIVHLRPPDDSGIGAAAHVASFVARAVATSLARLQSSEWESMLRDEERALTELCERFDALGSVPRELIDSFAESDELLAATCRQLVRAFSAYDAKATELTVDYLSIYLQDALKRHIRNLPQWQIPGLWFDGLASMAISVNEASRIRVSGWVYCASSQESWHEPLYFDLRLYPRSGHFQGYRLQFGDLRARDQKPAHRPIIADHERSRGSMPFQIVDTPPKVPLAVGGWAEEFVRGKVPEWPVPERSPNC